MLRPVAQRPLSVPRRKLGPWLTRHREALRREIAAIDRLDAEKVAVDIRARTRDRKLARKYVRNMPRMLRELDQHGISEKEFCATLGRGQSYAQMHRRMQLLPDANWSCYLKRRDELGNNGVFGLPYAVRLAMGERATSSQPLRTPSESGTLDDRVQHITSDALPALQGMDTESVDIGVTSPPYWPARRMYVPGDMHQIGFEPTLEEYLDHVVRERFRELKRVLRDDGVLFVVIDDAISQPAKAYKLQTYDSRAEAKVKTQTSLPHPEHHAYPKEGQLAEYSGCVRGCDGRGWLDYQRPDHSEQRQLGQEGEFG